MNVRCNFCGHSFTLSREYMQKAVADAQEKKQSYHGLECANCRKLIKVSIKQMRRYVPRESTAE